MSHRLDCAACGVVDVGECECELDEDHKEDGILCSTCEENERIQEVINQLYATKNEAARVLEALLNWANSMGGWEAQCWQDATKLYEQLTGRRIDV